MFVSTLKTMYYRLHRTENDLSDEIISVLPACRCFTNLFGYVRIVRSAEEKWRNETEWLVALSGK